MEWLWLFLGIVGLGLIWLLILGMEKLSARLREHDEARRIAEQRLAERTAKAESDFLEQEYAKAAAKEFIENADFNDQDDPDTDAILQEAIDTLSSSELIESVTKRIMGAPKGTEEITAARSAFDQTPVRKVVAKGNGVLPVKVKPSTKSDLSKSEQKMLKKIKQGY
jgi:hypothetical protein